MKERKTLTKSLHTVTVVSRVAKHMLDNGAPLTATEACRKALRTLGMHDSWTQDDPTFAACVAAVLKMRPIAG